MLHALSFIAVGLFPLAIGGVVALGGRAFHRNTNGRYL